MSNTPSAASLLNDLVSFASVVGLPNDEIVSYVERYFQQQGATVHRLIGPEGDRSNLFATIGPADRPGILFSGHLDVVPAADQPGWLADPFKLRQDGPRLIGRGAVDMKGFVAAALSAVPDIVAAHPKVPVHIALSYDEEAGCRGVPHLIAALPDLCAPPLGCVIGEPTGLVPVLRHKGKATLRLKAAGVAGHSSRPDLGKNAIHALVPVFSEVLALETQLRNGAKDDAFAPPYSTVQIGKVTGGTAVNVIPDQAEASVELRALPGIDPRQALQSVIAAANAARIEAEVIAQYPGLAPNEESDLAQRLERLTGQAAQAAVSFGTEAGLFSQAGLPAIVCGPGDIGRAHRPEEYITLEELESARKFILDLVASVQ